ncbi:MAG: hypothetical protein Q9176_004650 [Flavoplaca citrina]
MAATATGGAAATDTAEDYTGFGDSETADAIGFGRSWGLAVVFVGISAGFTFML